MFGGNKVRKGIEFTSCEQCTLSPRLKSNRHPSSALLSAAGAHLCFQPDVDNNYIQVFTTVSVTCQVNSSLAAFVVHFR